MTDQSSTIARAFAEAPASTTPAVAPPPPDFSEEPRAAARPRPWFETAPEMMALVRAPWGCEHDNFLERKLGQVDAILTLQLDHLEDMAEDERASIAKQALATEMILGLLSEAVHLTIEKSADCSSDLDSAMAVLYLLDAAMFARGWDSIPFSEETMGWLFACVQDAVKRALAMPRPAGSLHHTSEQHAECAPEQLHEGAKAFKAMIEAMSERAGQDFEPFPSDIPADLPDPQNFRATAEILMNGLRSNLLDHRQSAHRQGFLRTMIVALSHVGDSTAPGTAWDDPIAYTQASWDADKADDPPGARARAMLEARPAKSPKRTRRAAA